MTDDNIYRAARQAAGLTQERWAEMLGVSAEAVRQYEAGKITPSDAVVRRMAEIAGMPVLAYWHLCRKSPLADEIFPEVELVPLPQAVCGLISRILRFTDSHYGDDLLRIAADGRVDEIEGSAYRKILRELEDIVQAALQVEYAETH